MKLKSTLCHGLWFLALFMSIFLTLMTQPANASTPTRVQVQMRRRGSDASTHSSPAMNFLYRFGRTARKKLHSMLKPNHKVDAEELLSHSSPAVDFFNRFRRTAKTKWESMLDQDYKAGMEDGPEARPDASFLGTKPKRKMFELKKFKTYQKSYQQRRRNRLKQQQKKKMMRTVINQQVKRFREEMAGEDVDPEDVSIEDEEDEMLPELDYQEGSSEEEAPNQRPNIILIVADDLGYNDVPWHNPDVGAPNLLQLARQGVILENYYVLPLCTPSRSALLTGIYPFRYGKQAGDSSPLSPTGLNTSLTILPQRLKDLGYSTHLLGKWHLGYCSWDYTPTRRGFDSFYGFYLGGQTYYTQYKKLTNKKGSLSWLNQNDVLPDYDYDWDTYNHTQNESLKDYPMQDFQDTSAYRWTSGGTDFRFNDAPLANLSGIYSNDLYANRALDVIRAHAAKNDGDSKDPLFMMLSSQAVHGPLQVPLEYRRKYTSTKNLARRTFLGMVDAFDELVGKVVDQLKTSGLYDNSVIIFTTDNGGSVQAGGNNFPLRGSKGGLYEGGTKGVSFIHSPLLPKTGYKYNGLMHILDLHDTILHVAEGGSSVRGGRGWRRSLLSTPIPEFDETGRDGLNMWPAILTNTESPRNSFVYNVRKKPLRGAIRRKNWKLIVGKGGRFDGWIPPTDVTSGSWDGGIFEEKCCSTWHSRIADNHVTLYNLKDDPLETTDVSYLNPDVTATLKSLLKKYAAQSRHPHKPKENPQGHPSLHGGFFSPGWCQAVA